MKKVFISGSRKITKLNLHIKEKLDSIIQNGYVVLVGDANGVDRAVQQYLLSKNYNDVVVYYVGNQCRNNLGNWDTATIRTNNLRKDFSYYSLKDIEMAKQADYGLAIWDAKSKGTLHNIVNLVKDNKKVRVYFHPQRRFYTIDSYSGLEKVINECDHSSIESFKSKLGLPQVLQKPLFSD
jgi:hypothetical protein